MTGTVAGGKLAAKTNIERNGEDFYKRIGSKGGRGGNTGGFYANPEKARLAGQKGGLLSRRGRGAQDKLEKNLPEILKAYKDGATYKDLADKYQCCVSTMSKFIKKHY